MNVSEELSQDRIIARQMTRAWPAFFEVFGRLTPVQRQVIPAIMDGKDVLICAATASGKTEAACAPLVELNIDRIRPWTILYISPTRALVNDLYERLYSPISRLGLRIARRTGDYHEPLNNQPHVILTTPESFDSLLCRGRSNETGHVLAYTVAVVLDEIHLLHGTARGEQVRWLLERLRRLKQFALEKKWITDSKLQIIGLSATIPNQQAVASSYMVNTEIINVTGSREIETYYPPDVVGPIEKVLPQYIKSLEQPEKILVFSKTRRRVDDLTAVFGQSLGVLGYKVVAHHGSLSKQVREEAEHLARIEDKIIIFATSTLEIGIDIGNLDLVVLDAPANDIPALLQRIGRGNRRTNRTRVLTCSTSKTEALIQTAMLSAAQEGWLGDGEHGPQHAVARQQVASFIFQSPRRARSRIQIQQLVDRCAPTVVAKSLLDFMLQMDEIERDGDGIKLGENWLELTSRGAIHSNIEDSAGATVVNQQTGEYIAHGVVFDGGKGLRTAGKLLEVKNIDGNQIEVRHTTDEYYAEGKWRYAARLGVARDGQAQAVRRYLGINESTWPVLWDKSSLYVFHFGGGRLATIIRMIAANADKTKEMASANGFFIRLHLQGGCDNKPEWLINTGSGLLELSLANNIDSLEKKLGRPWANKLLPIEARIDEIRGWLKLEQELDRIKNSQWTKVVDKRLESFLWTIVNGD